MRDFSSDHRWLSLNTATVRKQGDLVEIIEACARLGIRAIDPWRDQVAAIGLERAARAVRDAGLELSGYCRGGMFTADAAHRSEARDDNRRAVDEAKALGAPCIVLVVGGLPQYSRPGSAVSRDIVKARAQVEDAIAEMLVYASDASMPAEIRITAQTITARTPNRFMKAAANGPNNPNSMRRSASMVFIRRVASSGLASSPALSARRNSSARCNVERVLSWPPTIVKWS